MTDSDDLLPRAIAAHRAGRLGEAESGYRAILRRDAQAADALHLLGVLLAGTGHLEEGIGSIRQAIAVDPTAARFFSNLGKLLLDAGRVEEAVAACRTALSLKPEYPEALNNLAAALNAAGTFGAAAAASRDATRLRPDLASAHNNLGNALRGQGLTDEAVDAYRQAATLSPPMREAFHNLGNVFKDTGRIPEAIDAYRAALDLAPGSADTHDHLVNTVHYDPSFDGRRLCEAASEWYRRHGAVFAGEIRPHTNDRSPDRRLRIGYVSADFREHPVGLNLLPLFRAHDRSRFAVWCYSGVRRADALTARFRDLSDGWRGTASMPDGRLADAVREDEIDILVDLSLHSAGNRLLVFARKPAPVQVTFAGYPGTTGVPTIDYRLTDPFLDPPGGEDGHSAEEPLRLPDTFWCYDPLTDEPVRPLPAIARGIVTFGCLNNFCKVNEGSLRLWAAPIRRVAHSRLRLLCPRGRQRLRVLDVLEGEGVDASRVEFVDQRPRLDYLRAYHSIDIGLDTLPYNGHTTSLDAFWMGVPVVTLVGNTIVGRAGLSQLMNLGLPELVTRTPGDFIHAASTLAADLPRLAQLRGGLRERMRTSPLGDGPRFAANIEAAYRAIWQKWCGAHE